jgi:hypothetical protein
VLGASLEDAACRTPCVSTVSGSVRLDDCGRQPSPCLASGAGLSAVFLSSAIIVLSAAFVAVWLLVGSTSRARSFR